MRKEIIEGLFWIAVGIFFAFFGVKLNLGTLNTPGPGFLPVVMAVVLIFLALLLIGRSLMRTATLAIGIPWKRPALMICYVFLYGFLLEFVGFFLSTLILMFLQLGLLKGKGRWSGVLIYAAATSLGAWLVFSVAMDIPFPLSRLSTLWR